ncbi:MAG: 2-hydroxyacid dehydrogenase [Acidobacteria bacterium]|nr:2-hydroxyacid dehydrogenase [Acidobacteriota bacterium]
MKVVLHYAAGPGLTRRVAEAERQHGLRVAICPVADRARYRTEMADAEVLWHLLDPVSDAVLEAAPALRLVQKIGVGVNTIDLEAARRRGVAVCNMPGTNTQAVAEMTLLLILAALRRVARLDAATRAGEGWRLPAEVQDRYGEVRGRTVGLVGYGAVPGRLAPMLAAMGARVLFASRSPKPDATGERRSLDALLRESDVVSLHLPLTAETERLIDAAAIARMKPGAVLVNTARGALVDEAALADALGRGHLGAAGLDVFEVEPVPPGSPLLDLDNVVVTPHVAWLTQETMERSLAVAAENCRRLGANEPLLHRVV